MAWEYGHVNTEANAGCFFVITCICTYIAKGEEPDSGKQLIGIMETLNGLATEAVP
jgi:hypothetical protein